MTLNKIALLAMSSVSVRSIAAFEGEKKPGFKLDADGKLVLGADGNPVYVNATGVESSFNYEATAATIARLNREAQTHREAAEAANVKLKAYEGIDPVAAAAAFEQLSKIDQKKLIDAGEVDRVKADISKGFQTLIDAETGKNRDLQTRLDNTLLDHAFGTSQYIKDKIAIPADMIRAQFGSRFQVKDGKIVALNSDGTTITSRDRMGEPATVDEALAIIVDGYSHKDSILKGNNNQGTGNQGNGGNQGGKKVYKRAEFDAIEARSPSDAAKIAAEMNAGTAIITD